MKSSVSFKGFPVTLICFSLIIVECTAQDSTDVSALLIYPNTVGTYQRYEYQVTLPTYPVHFKNDIDSFLLNPSWSPTNSPAIDPYDPNQMEVEGVFTSPTHQSYTRYGFFYQDVTTKGDTFNAPTDNPYPFRIRFAPPDTGTWKVTIYLYYKGVNLIGHPFQDSFRVNINTGNPGNLLMGKNNHLKFENGTGFYGVGQDIAFANPGGYQSGPSDYNTFRKTISDFSLKNGNLFRLCTDPWSLSLETGETVLCNYQQSAAMEIDSTLSLSEESGVYFMLTVTDFAFWVQSWPFFSWNSSGLFGNPYYYMLGQPASPGKFLTDSLAIAAYKNYLFYVNARWGYSPCIALYDLMGEADQFGNGCPVSYMSSDTVQMECCNWMRTMTNYLHSFYPVHLVTTGYTQPIGNHYNDNSYTFLDVSSWHNYANDKPNLPNVNEGRFSALPVNSYAGNVPFIFGEIGDEAICTPDACNNCNEGCSVDGCTDAGFHNGIWATSFMNCIGSGLNWWDWVQPCGPDHRAINFKPLRNFFAIRDLQDSCYVPGSYAFSNLQNNTWSLSCHGIELYTMFNCGGNHVKYEIGYFHNVSVTWENSGASCIADSECGTPGTPYSINDVTIPFGNLIQNGNYNFSLYNTYSGQWEFQNEQLTADSTGTINYTPILSDSAILSYPFTPEPDYAFSLIYSGGGNEINSIASLTNLIKVEPNPVKNIFTILVPDNTRIDRMEIFDAFGRSCMLVDEPRKYQFDISNLTDGVYLLNVSAGQRIYNVRLIKVN